MTKTTVMLDQIESVSRQALVQHGAVIGTNPIVMSIPAKEGGVAFQFDQSTSAVAGANRVLPTEVQIDESVWSLAQSLCAQVSGAQG